jgi:sporulation protein YlmC with PRC-barrel domain
MRSTLASVRASQLQGRLLIDLDDAEFVGVVCDIEVDVVSSRVIAVTACNTPDADDLQRVPFAAIQGHNFDLVLVRGAERSVDNSRWIALSDLCTRSVVTQRGQTVGIITDAILNPMDQHVSAYVLRVDDGGFASILSHVRQTELYVRPDAEIHLGSDWIVVAEEAVACRSPELDVAESRAAVRIRWPSGARTKILAAMGIIALWITGLEIIRPLFGAH